MAEKMYRAELTGVFGDPVDGNPTGVVMEAGYEATGLNYRYLTMYVPIENLKPAMDGMRAVGMRGVNLTMPHKVEVIKYLDGLSEAARIIGAVNTVVRRGDKYIGENTDGKGFVRSLTDAGISLEGKTITLLGAGGAAKAIGVECALAGVKHITVINRNVQRGEELAETIRTQTKANAEFIAWEGTAHIPAETEILVNATCVGLAPNGDECPDIAYAAITPAMTACDVVFNPAVTVFMRRCTERGARVLSGLGMLASQAAMNFELWTDIKAPRDLMLTTLAKEFEE